MPLVDINLLPDAFNLVAAEAEKFTVLLQPLAKTILGYAVLFSGTWLLLKESLTSSPRNAIAGLMLLLMQAAIALAVIMNWQVFADIAYGLSSALATTLGGSTTAMTVMLEPISKGIADIGNAVTTFGLIPPAESQTPWGELKETFLNIWTSLQAMPFKILFGFLAIMILGLIAAVLGGAIMFAEISLGIGLAAAPVMLALNFFPYFNFTIDGLVRFLLGAVLLKFVAMLTAVILGGVIGTTVQGVTTMASGGGTQIVALIFVLFVAGAFLYAAIKVDDIARALMSGGVVGGPGAKVVSGGMATLGQSAAGGAVGGGVGAAMGAKSGGVGGAVKGGAQGASNSSGYGRYMGNVSKPPSKPG